MIHHNVEDFIYIRGGEKNSKSYFKDGLYFVTTRSSLFI